MTKKLTESRNALKESEKKYATLVEQNNNGILITNRRHEIKYANSAMGTLLCRPLDGIIGHDFRELLAETDRKKIEAKQMDRVFSENLHVKKETNFQRGDGQEITVELSGKMMEIDGEKCVMVVVNDITERKQTERMLQFQKELINRILATTPDSVMAVDSNNDIFYANPALEKINKETNYTLCGDKIDRVLPRCNLFHIINRVRQKQKIQERTEFGYVIDDKKRILAAEIINMEHGDILVTIRDVTEEREKQERLYLTSRLVSIGEMASGIAHELNNPLTSIVGLSQLLLENHIPEDIKDDITGINSEARRAAGVVKNLLTFVRNHSHEKNLIQINSVIDDVLMLRAHEHRVNNITITAQLDSALPEVLADYHQMQQVFLNIVLNAESAMIEAFQGGNLVITTSRSGDWIRITLHNDGPAIRPENLPHIFDPFFTTKDVGKGTGLGLSICYGIISGHGGHIFATSDANRGVTFVIELPGRDIDDRQ